MILVASAGGARRRVKVQVGNQTRGMLARTAEGSERARLWERVVRQYPTCADYQRRAGRLIPVVVLEPIHEDVYSPLGRGETVEVRD